MKENSLRQALRTIGQEAVPDGWNRWDEIRQRIRQESGDVRPAASENRWLKRAAVLLLVLLVSTGGIYAFVQVNLPTGDTGLDGIKEAGLVTELNLIQTIEGVQVQLNWAYIDEGRAILNFQTFLVDGESRDAADADEPYLVRLSERGGRLPDLYPNRFDSASYPQPVTFAFNLADQKAVLQDDSETLDLRLEIAYTQRPRIRNALERIFYSEVSRSNFGWGVDGIREPLPPEALSFVFDFTLPIQRAVTLEPMLTVTAAGIPMTLRRISVAPSQSELRLCYTLPENETRGWVVEEVTLTVNGVEADWTGGASGPKKYGRYCSTSYFQGYSQLPAAVTFTVEALGRYPDYSADELLSVQREMAARGIEMRVDVNPDGTVGGYTWPSNTEEAQAALVELGYRIEGPWVFTLELRIRVAK